MQKICKKCGRTFDGLSWEEDLCWRCRKEKEKLQVQERIRNAEDGEEVDTWSSDYVFCPYCGCAIETDLGYEDWPELYEEGSNEEECPECGKKFILETSVSYSWETKKASS